MATQVGPQSINPIASIAFVDDIYAQSLPLFADSSFLFCQLQHCLHTGSTSFLITSNHLYGTVDPVHLVFIQPNKHNIHHHHVLPDQFQEGLELPSDEHFAHSLSVHFGFASQCVGELLIDTQEISLSI